MGRLRQGFGAPCPPRPLSDLVVCILCMLVIMMAIPFVICILIAFTLADHLERLCSKRKTLR